MIEEDFEVCIKVIIVGNGAVGKSSMIQRYCKGFFTKNYKKTIGVDFLEKEIEIEEDLFRLMLWDTAGQEEYDAITKSYYRGAQACIIVFSTVDSDSFEAVPIWNQKVIDEVGHVNTVLVLNKMDLIRGALVTELDADNLAKKMNMKLFKTSVKNNENVNDIFTYLAQSHMQFSRENARNSSLSQYRYVQEGNI
ncbi:DgyrCDS1410 [Dimorphilus gyrociliatus]|uniref:DgyrCDS1410 n=1 Tax=Dimorphilus gyrociliatus TaxID=2664684 RepID=A0A7I8V7C2_9ANNE|nr:DgyrCDS1410 [Dimorphilus gyrociliatus]